MKKKDNSDIINNTSPVIKKTPGKWKSFTSSIAQKCDEVFKFCKTMAGVITGLVFLSYGGYAVLKLSQTSNAAWRIAFAVWATSSIMAGFVILWRTVQKISK